jgi:hypothetical protein
MGSYGRGRLRLISRQLIRERAGRHHPLGEGFLHPFGLIHRQTVLGLHDGDRAGLEVTFGEGFDLQDELRPDRGGLLGIELFPDRWGGPCPAGDRRRA